MLTLHKCYLFFVSMATSIHIITTIIKSNFILHFTLIMFFFFDGPRSIFDIILDT